MVASCGGHGLLYFVTDVSCLLRNYRIAVFPERNLGQSQSNETLGPQIRAWQDSAIERPRSCLVSSAHPSVGAYADHPSIFWSYVHDGIYGPKPARFLGWSISVLVHAALLAAIVLSNLYMTSLRAIPQKEPFRWEVSLMAAPNVEAVVADGVESQETASLAEIDPGDMAEARPVEQVEAYSSHRNESVIQEMTTPAVSPRQQADQERVSEKSRRKVHDLKSVAAVPVMRSSESVLPPPEVEHQRDSDRLQVEAQPESPTVFQRPQVFTRPLIDRIALPDYGWLMNTLRSKLERVKIYPASAKAGHVQGRVVVQVSIYGDGRIANPEIEESSGSSILDQAALDALLAASPLTLSHRLEGTPIVMLVPLNYQLE
jgi:periplasmic protein TonB